MSIRELLRKRFLRRLFRTCYYPFLARMVRRDLRFIRSVPSPVYAEGKDVLYLRTDLWGRRSSASGAIAHTKGVVEAFVHKGKDVCICSPDRFGYITEKVEYELVNPNSMNSFGINELGEMEYNQLIVTRLLSRYRGHKPSFVYQRYGLNNYSGAYAAKKLGVPFVLEYNGSEIWMSQHWGNPLHYEEITKSVEKANFDAADIIVGNAESMADELVSAGVDRKKICIIPNGVDETRFSPSIDGTHIRQQLGYTRDDVVVTFIGTFGPWHGAEVLAQTISAVCAENPKVHYLFIGGGGSIKLVHSIAKSSGFQNHVKMIGFVPQLEAPEYLAASDILVSPQIPNPDGTPFFGSPTKLFEYMAMGKAIVASDLDQMGRILSHNKTALLATPGSAEGLADSILTLAKDEKLRRTLGMNAREEVCEKYTWNIHVQKILDALRAI